MQNRFFHQILFGYPYLYLLLAASRKPIAQTVGFLLRNAPKGKAVAWRDDGKIASVKKLQYDIRGNSGAFRVQSVDAGVFLKKKFSYDINSVLVKAVFPK